MKPKTFHLRATKTRKMRTKLSNIATLKTSWLLKTTLNKTLETIQITKTRTTSMTHPATVQ